MDCRPHPLGCQVSAASSASGFDAEPVAQRLELGVAERVEPGGVEHGLRGVLVAGADLAERLGGGQGVIEGELAASWEGWCWRLFQSPV